MQRLSVGGARDQLADALNRVAYRGERIIIERRGKSLAAVVPMEDLELLQALEDRIDLEEAREALAEAEREGTVPWEQVKAELGL
jgi:prevent-host-death family protein